MSKYTILIIEDDEFIREGLALNFALEKFRVLVATKLSEAVCLIESESVDFIICDIFLGSDYGPDVLRSLKKMLFNRPHIVFITGREDVNQQEMISKGALDLLVKPFDMEVLENYIAASHRLKKLSWVS